MKSKEFDLPPESSCSRHENARVLRRASDTPRLAADGQSRLGRLHAAIETGLADASDPTLRDQLAFVKTERDLAQVSLDRAIAEASPQSWLTDEKIATFADLMWANVVSGDVSFRRAYIRSIIDQVEVDDAEIRISGRRSVLERLVVGGGKPAGVPSFVAPPPAPNCRP